MNQPIGKMQGQTSFLDLSEQSAITEELSALGIPVTEEHTVSAFMEMVSRIQNTSAHQRTSTMLSMDLSPLGLTRLDEARLRAALLDEVDPVATWSVQQEGQRGWRIQARIRALL